MGNYKKLVILLFVCLCLGACKKAKNGMQGYDSLAGKNRFEERETDAKNQAETKNKTNIEDCEWEETEVFSEKTADKAAGGTEPAQSGQKETESTEPRKNGSGEASEEKKANGSASLPKESTPPTEENTPSREEGAPPSEENTPSREEGTPPPNESTPPPEGGSSDLGEGGGCAHEMTAEWYGEAPNCTHGGYRIVRCRLCGWVDEAAGGSVDALEHTPAGQEICHGNCREDTIIIYTCTACGQQVGYERHPEPSEHSWVVKEQQIWDEETFAFITVSVQVCERCNIQYQE